MRNTRKRHYSDNAGTSDADEAEPGNNTNGNHATVQQRKISKDQHKLENLGNKSPKRAKVNEKSKAKFHEDDTEVEMEVQGEHLSDGECQDTDESHNESENEQESELSDNEGPNPDESVESETEQGYQQSDNEDSEEERQRRKAEKLQRKKERKARQTSLEDKIDSMAESMKVMQEIMIQQGLCNGKTN